MSSSEEPKSAMKALQLKSEYVHQLADKSVAQILSHHRPSPGNMYFSNKKASAADLEQEFTNRMKDSGSKVTSRTIHHASKTFDEIISQDSHFGTLLYKIKKAYDTYIRKKCGDLQSEEEWPSYQELQAKVKNLEGALQDKNSVISKLEKEFLEMRSQVERSIEEKATKDSIIHDLKARIDVLNKQLTEVKKENEELRRYRGEGDTDEKDDQIRKLIHDNTILNDECIRLRNEWDYLIMHQEMHDNNVKNIPTKRFYEFVEAQSKAPYPYYPHETNHPHYTQNIPHSYSQYNLNAPYDPEQHSKAYSEPEPIKKSEISFNSEDSYEPLASIQAVKIKPKPANIPTLVLEGLPEYETSSEEDEGDHHYEVPYQNGYNYIDNFYKKIDYGYPSMKDSHFELSNEGENPKQALKKSLMYSKSNARSSSLDLKMSESF